MKEMEVSMLELTPGEWSWVTYALEVLRQERVIEGSDETEVQSLLHKIRDADVWGYSGS